MRGRGRVPCLTLGNLHACACAWASDGSTTCGCLTLGAAGEPKTWEMQSGMQHQHVASRTWRRLVTWVDRGLNVRETAWVSVSNDTLWYVGMVFRVGLGFWNEHRRVWVILG